MSLSDKREALHQKTFLMMFRVLFYFGIPAAGAFFLGRYLDENYINKPFGSLLALGLAFILSWTLVIRLYFSINKEYKDLEALEAEEEIIENK